MKQDITIRDLYEAINSFRDEIRGSYVTKQEFSGRIGPVEKIVYGIVGVVLMAVVTALVALVVNTGGIQAKW